MNNIVILCGQPRSGTSMLMRMLEMGGIEIDKDSVLDNKHRMEKFRNPHGFFETHTPTYTKSFKAWNPVMIMGAPEGTKFIYIERDIDQVEKSWKDVMGNQEQDSMERIRRTRLLWQEIIANRPHLALKTEEVIKDPLGTAQKIADFIEQPFNVVNASKAVDTTLLKQR